MNAGGNLEIIDPNAYPSASEDKRKLLQALVFGLVGLGLVSVVGCIALVAMDKSVEAIAPFATLVIGGLIGLFAPSPGANQLAVIKTS